MRTSREGWRVVAIGVFFLLFGFSLISYHTGPGWIGGLLLLIGLIGIVVGRRL